MTIMAPPKQESPALQAMQARIRSRSLARGYHHELYDRAAEMYEGLSVTYPGEPVQTVMTTYDYLGLVGHPLLNERAKQAIDKYGTGGHGAAACSSSLSLHRELERRLAAFVGHEDAVALPTGFQANITVIPTLVGKGDWIFSDKLNHASIYDGCKLAESRGVHLRYFDHNNPDHLRSLLAEAPSNRLKLIVADSVFSADGDVLDLPAFKTVCDEFGAVLYLDEGHGLGVLGEEGRGLHEHFGLSPAPTSLIMSGLGKALSSAGGFVAAPRSITKLLRTAAPGNVFSGRLPAASAAAALAALDVNEQDGAVLRARLHENVAYFIDRASRAELITRPSGRHHSGIVPVFVDDDQRALRIAAHCRDHGVMVVPFVFPITPRGAGRLRINITTRHTPDVLDPAIECLTAAFRDTA
ncbi:aminotransferase class I/II-fold pyridoxal phosphate-dependent enzyme [Streptomyces spectabilis]|uniref:8-amino-7-oxononanoate synthase n=1 Tax=Streptomyces spectabilis TaxID=68270 RepID=A0A7W8B491_STRST|nr:aminotransferase class I/II-fold pyridoxal phosphate-dependent enzyme [Streptomyces spectabilis]MBB5110056.1 7-keto-8-aminopelargonate synthetase-like enzyme [Streptomyces spectabilis]GGV57740.1 8-amino-7-oxononanoate synthase [Streptomyces spectabilis]